MTVDSRRLVGLLADEARRRIVAVLVLAGEPLPTHEIAVRAGVTPRQTVEGLDRLGDLVHLEDRKSTRLNSSHSSVSRMPSSA